MASIREAEDVQLSDGKQFKVERLGEKHGIVDEVEVIKEPTVVDLEYLLEHNSSRGSNETGSSQLAYLLNIWEHKQANDVEHWRQYAMHLENLMKENSIHRGPEKLDENVKNLEMQALSVEELVQDDLNGDDRFLHCILRNAPVVLGHQDKELRYRFIYNHILIFEEKDIIGKNDVEIFNGAGIKELQDFKTEVMERGLPANREVTFDTPFMGPKVFIIFVEPVFSKAGETIGVNYIGIDVTPDHMPPIFTLEGSYDAPRGTMNCIAAEDKGAINVDSVQDDAVVYWKERAMHLKKLLEESLRSEQSTTKVNLLEIAEHLERQSFSPVEEHSQMRKNADSFLHFVLQNAPVILGHQDKELRYGFIYNYFPSFKPEDIIGKTDVEIFTGPGVKESHDFKQEVLERGVSAKREITFHAPLIGAKTFLMYVEPVFDKAGETVGVNYIGMDVTDQQVQRKKNADSENSIDPLMITPPSFQEYGVRLQQDWPQKFC